MEHRLHRIARREVRAALAALEGGQPTVAAVHRVRRCVKNVRAIVRLMHDDGGTRLGRSVRRLRHVALALAPIRDIDAMRQSLGALDSEDRSALPGGTVARLQRRLRTSRRSLLKSSRGKALIADVREELRGLLDQIGRWHQASRGFRALVPGLTRSHVECRKTLRRAMRSGSNADYHEWRKAMARLRRQMVLVMGRKTPMHEDLVAIETAEACLGEDHNLTLVQQLLAGEAGRGEPVPGTAALNRVLARRQRAARSSALKLAGPVCLRATRSACLSFETAWRATAPR